MTQVISFAKDMEPGPGYRLTHFLGRGGLGEVWKAAGPHGKDVAVKFMPCDNHLTTAKEVRALQSVRQLDHPNLIRIHQIWGGSGYVAVAMELAEGSLLDLLQVYLEECGRPILPQHLCFFLAQAAQAIDFLNARQHHLNENRVAVRHCDVKPSNLLVMGKTVKLADFSLTVQTTSSMWYCRRVGTLDYAAPEIFQGWLSDRSDQYALAVSYCVLRGGRLPFADTPSTFDPMYVRPTPDLSRLSAAEQPVLVRALDHVPQNRWPSCVEMIGQLNAAVS